MMAVTANAENADMGQEAQDPPQDQAALNDLANITQTKQTQNQCIRWNGTWPTATGPMASKLVPTHLGSLDDQRQAAKAYYELLSQDDPDLRDLNGDGPPVANILILPESCNVRIVCKLGYPQNILYGSYQFVWTDGRLAAFGNRPRHDPTTSAPNNCAHQTKILPPFQRDAGPKISKLAYFLAGLEGEQGYGQRCSRGINAPGTSSLLHHHRWTRPRPGQLGTGRKTLFCGQCGQ